MFLPTRRRARSLRRRTRSTAAEAAGWLVCGRAAGLAPSVALRPRRRFGHGSFPRAARKRQARGCAAGFARRCDNVRKIQSTLLQHCRLIDRQNMVTTMYLSQENRNNVTTMQNVVTLLQQYSEVFFL